ncbi:histidinol-phosphatase [Maritalea sp.]|jgi:myo-inositol-1(or 4)-monophosphatase|uniref:histidinol-phosphatase n=1 Tax=Maritalea sp. TaxID=2003361 RepID=UPI0039E68C92
MTNQPINSVPDLDFDLIHRILLEAADKAQETTLKYFRRTINVENKLQSGFDPVTVADREAELAIRAVITDHFPDHSISGEEWDNKEMNSPFRWIIDPIDGTRAFISGLPVWGTLIALTYNGRSIAGLMSQPHIGENFIGLPNKAFLTRNNNETALQTSAIKDLSQSTIFTTSPRIFLLEKSLAAYDTLENNVKLARYGLDCYAYAMVAAGHGELVVEEGLKSVDIAAMIPIIEQAGGIVTTWSGKQATQGGQVIAAANEKIHSAALTILSPAATD